MTPRSIAAPMTVSRLHELLTAARCLFFDFDGPLVNLYGAHRASDVAETLWKSVNSWELEVELTEPNNPTQILLDLAHHLAGPELDHHVVELGKLLADQEIIAVASAPPTPYADLLVRRLSARGRTIAVTTNNSAEAAVGYLRLRGLTACFAGHVYGRSVDPRLMKPDPTCVRAALDGTGAEPGACLLIGDSPHDYEAARAAEVPFLGYARNTGKERMLREAGAVHIVNSLAPVYEAAAEA